MKFHQERRPHSEREEIHEYLTGLLMHDQVLSYLNTDEEAISYAQGLVRERFEGDILMAGRRKAGTKGIKRVLAVRAALMELRDAITDAIASPAGAEVIAELRAEAKANVKRLVEFLSQPALPAAQAVGELLKEITS